LLSVPGRRAAAPCRGGAAVRRCPFPLFLALLPSLLTAETARPGGGRPSPPDRLSAADVPAAERPHWLPREVVAVVGTQRGRHWQGVTCLAVSADRTLAATATAGGIHLWDAATLRERAWLTGEAAEHVAALAFAPDGKTLASAGGGLRSRGGKSVPGNCAVRLWDLAGAVPRVRAVLDGFRDPVTAVAFSPDGKTLAAHGDLGIRLWDLGGGKPRPWVGSQSLFQTDRD